VTTERTSAPSASGILHVDLDAFYASVEQLADPGLRGRPVVVGGLGPRGVVAAASYEAREFGVFSAMPMARARRACPRGVFLSPRFDAYAAASRTVMGILRSVTPVVEPVSLDEAFLDVRGARRLLGDGPTIGRDLRMRIKDEAGLVASVGVATTKMMAKIGSDLAKPDGLLVIEPGTELEMLHPLSVDRLWGVGPATRRRLDRYGVETVGDLAALPEDTLVSALGRAQGIHLHALAWNVDERSVEPDRVAKSIGHEETFPRDIVDRSTLEHEISRLSDKVASRLRAASSVARTVQLKLRYHDFRTITRAKTLAEPVDLAADLARVAIGLLSGVELGEGIRLLGLSAQQLQSAEAVQTALALDPTDESRIDAADHEQRSRLERTVDKVRERYGDGAVVPARFAASGSDARREQWPEPPQ